MALSMTTALQRIRTLVAECSGLERVYGEGNSDANRLPAGVFDLPCAVVITGQSVAYILSTGQHRHTYEVRIFVFDGGSDVGERASTVLPFVDAIIEKFAVNVALGERVNQCIFVRHTGLGSIDYGGVEYTGHEIVLQVSEQASATPAIGS